MIIQFHFFLNNTAKSHDVNEILILCCHGMPLRYAHNDLKTGLKLLLLMRSRGNIQTVYKININLINTKIIWNNSFLKNNLFKVCLPEDH